MIQIVKRYVQLAALGAVLMLIAGASPATAATGDGAGEGHFVFTPTATGVPLCQNVTGTYTGTYTGTMEATSSTADYAGVLTATFTFTAWGSPAGTFTNSTCTVPGTGDISKLTLVGYNDTSGTDVVECEFDSDGDEKFQRVGSTWEATADGDGTPDGCKVGAATATNESTTLTLTGVLTAPMPVGPCSPGPALGPCPSMGDEFVAQ